MIVFDLVFTQDAPERGKGGRKALVGEIVIGEHSERFLAALGLWDRGDYERHWIEAARRILHDEDRTAFVTSAFQFWWPMWRQGRVVFVHEQLLWAEPIARVFDPSNLYASIGDRAHVTDEGAVISEWQLRIPDIEDFIDRRTQAYTSG